jgi:hypothetical protein
LPSDGCGRQHGTESGTLGPTQATVSPFASISAIPHDLKIIMDGWATLPAAIRAGIVAMVERMSRG